MTLSKHAIGMLVAKYKSVLKNMLIKGCVALLVFAAPAPSLADEITVTNTNDSGAGSLRNAILSANSGDTINFAASLNGKTILLGSTITIDKNISFAVPDDVTVIIDGADGVGPLLSSNANTVLDFSGAGLVIKNGNNSQLGLSVNAYAAGGGVFVRDRIDTQSGKISGNTASASSDTGNAYAAGGGVLADSSITTLAGEISGNTAIATSNTGNAEIYGGGVEANSSITTFSGDISGNTAIATSNTGNAEIYGGGVFVWDNIDTLSGQISRNTASAVTNGTGHAEAYGGGVDAGSITTLSGDISGNNAIATSGTGYAEVHGGGVFVWDNIDTLSGQISRNTASAVTNGTGYAEAHGGGVDADSIITLSGKVSDNTASSKVTSGAGNAETYGGGVSVWNRIDALSGQIIGNTASATSDTGYVYATGGGVFAGNSIDILSGQVVGNTVTGTSDTGDAYAAGGGVAIGWYDGAADARMGTLSGQIRDNKAIATSNTGSATVYGGGVRVWDSIDTLAGQVSGNTASATVTNGSGDAQASGGGVDLYNSIITFSGEVSGNRAIATCDSGNAESYGGGVNVWNSIDTLSGQIIGNTAATKVTSGAGNAETYGGGVSAWNSIDALSGQISGNTASATSNTGYTYTAGGGVFAANSIDILSGQVSGNTVSGTNDTGEAYAAGGGVAVGWFDGTDDARMGILSGQISDNKAIAASNTGSAFVYGGGVRVWDNIDTLSGRISDNSVLAISDTGDAQATGGGMDANSITTLLGEVSGNSATANSGTGKAETYGGGVSAWDSINTLSGQISGNTALAFSDKGDAQASGGGVDADSITTLSGEVSGNIASAKVTTGSYLVLAEAYGGGVHVDDNITILSGEVSDNTAIATYSIGSASAHGGGVSAWGSIDALSGQIIGNTASATSSTGSVYATGGGVDAYSINTLSGEVSDNTAIAISGTGYAYATGGGVDAYRINTLSGEVSDNTAIATSNAGLAESNGGGVSAMDSIYTLSGQISGNTASATSGKGDAEAHGGGVDANSITTLSGEVSGNTVIAISNSGFAQAHGGGVSTWSSIDRSTDILSGKINNNTASATSDSSFAYASGGGMRAGRITALSGEISGNTAIATVTSGSSEAWALGGGAYLQCSYDVTIRQGRFENNRAIASGNMDSRAEGGALFLNTTGVSASLTLKPVDGDIIFRNNTVSVNATTTANDLTFGRLHPNLPSLKDAYLNIGDGPYNVYLAGGVTVDMNNGQSFTMTREGSSNSGNFFWGGNNVFMTSGGKAAVNLVSGTTTLEQGFNLKGNNLSFTLGQDALLQVKPTIQPATINAASITFEANSRLALDSSFVHGPVLTLGQNHTLLTMNTDSFNDQGAVLHSDAGTFKMGAYDYQYNLDWNSDAGGKLSFTPISSSFVPERGGAYATQASLYTALANKTSSVIFDRQGDRFRHLEQNSSDERMWAAPFYQTIRTDSQGGMVGAKVNNPGIILGYDKKISGQSFFGGAASISWPDYDAGGNRTEGDDIRLFIYGGSKINGGFEFSYAAGYGWGNLEQNRAIYGQRYDATYHNNTYTLGLGIAKPSVHKNVTVRPYLSYEYLGIKTDAYSEGAGTYALGFDKQRQDVHLVRFGADVIRENQDGFFKYGLFYLGNYGDRRGQTRAYFTADPTNPFTSVGAPLDQNSLGLNIGIGRAINAVTDFSLNYAALLGSKGSSHNANLKLTYKF